MKFKQTVHQQNKVEIMSEFKLIASGKLRHDRVERLKRPPTENAKILFNDAEESRQRVPQRYGKTYLTKIFLEISSQASRDIPWTMTSQNLFSQTDQGC